MNSTHAFIPQMEPWFDHSEADALHSYMMSGGWVTEFKKTQQFEEELCRFTGAQYCVATTNGTVSLAMMLLALDIGPGDEVLVPNLTMIATANAVKLVGARPVFVDVDAQFLCMEKEAARQAITKKTKAMFYVSFNGRAGALRELCALAEEHDLHFLEDAAQSLGSFHQGKHLGTFGLMGSFSFSTPKIISTGQGGAIITNNTALSTRLRRLKDFGRTSGGNDIHEEIGWNFKFTDLQAVLGIEQMKKLPERIERKQAIYEHYKQNLSACPAVRLLEFKPYELPWFVDIYVEHREELAEYLRQQQIGTRSIYPPIHSQKVYGGGGHFSVTEHFSQEGLWLPSAVRLKDSEIEYICSSIRKFYRL